MVDLQCRWRSPSLPARGAATHVAPRAKVTMVVIGICADGCRALAVLIPILWWFGLRTDRRLVAFVAYAVQPMSNCTLLGSRPRASVPAGGG